MPEPYGDCASCRWLAGDTCMCSRSVHYREEIEDAQETTCRQYQKEGAET